MVLPRMKKCFFLRGLVREAGHWHGFLERFAAAFPGVEAVALDIPGNGVHFREASPLSVPGMAEFMRREFLSRRGEENYLFALSLGGMVGVEWLHRWPDDFRKAVLVNTSLRGLSPLHHRLRPRNYARIARMMLSGKPSLVETGILAMTSARTEGAEEITQAWLKIHQARPVSVRNAVRQLVAAARFHPPQAKPKIPVLILNGGRDQLVNPACSRALAAHWSLPLHTHPAAGHDLTLDEPEWVLERLKEFLLP